MTDHKIPDDCCLKCQFLAWKGYPPVKPDKPKELLCFEVKEEERRLKMPRTTEKKRSHGNPYPLIAGCYHDVWGKCGDDASPRPEPEEFQSILTTPRGETCFFFAYEEGRGFEAARELERRTATRRENDRDRESYADQADKNRASSAKDSCKNRKNNTEQSAADRKHYAKEQKWLIWVLILTAVLTCATNLIVGLRRPPTIGRPLPPSVEVSAPVPVVNIESVSESAEEHEEAESHEERTIEVP